MNVNKLMPIRVLTNAPTVSYLEKNNTDVRMREGLKLATAVARKARQQ